MTPSAASSTWQPFSMTKLTLAALKSLSDLARKQFGELESRPQAAHAGDGHLLCDGTVHAPRVCSLVVGRSEVSTGDASVHCRLASDLRRHNPMISY